MSSLPITERVVDFALTATVPLGDGLPRTEVINALTDSLGVCIAGGGSALAHVVDRYRGQEAQPLAGPQWAMALGALGHALDYDDSVPLIPGHPSVPVLAALLASLPAAPVSGRDFVEAYAVGVEVGAKIGKAAGGGHYKRGWHATSTHGCLGAVAALGRFHGLPPETLRRAMGIAVSLVSGLQCNFGTMTKPLHAGFAAQHAVVAIDLAIAGATATEHGLEAPQGYFDVYGTDATEPETAAVELGTPWAFAEPGVYLKRYPCCYATHRGIAAVEAILSEADIDPADIASVLCEVPVGGLRPLRHDEPQSGFEGKFSMQYSLAAKFIDGDVGLDSFEDAAVQRDEIQSLMKKMVVRESPDCSPDDPQGIRGSAGTRGYILVVTTLESGEVYSSEQHTPPGARENRLSTDEVSTKFIDCLRYVGIDEVPARELLQSLLVIDEQNDVVPSLSTVSEFCGMSRRER